MNRSFAHHFDGLRKSEFITFKENNDQPYLTYFQPMHQDDHYYLPPTTLTIKGEAALKKLYYTLLRLDKKYDLSQEYPTIRERNVITLTPVRIEPAIYLVIDRGSFKFVEVDQIIEGGGYKPTKQISTDENAILKIYDLLQHVYGVPLSMKFRYCKEEALKEEVKEEEKEVKKTGWEILK